MSAAEVFAWVVWHRLDNHQTTVNHRTRGGAIAEYMRDFSDCMPDVKFTDMRARKLGPASTSARLQRVAECRGMPWVRAGMRVTVCGDMAGVIVDGNESANFDVLLDDGVRVNCHPCDLRFDAIHPQGGGK